MDYSNFKFPEYKFQEFPKWVEVDGVKIVVDSPEEEQAALNMPKRRGHPPKDSK